MVAPPPHLRYNNIKFIPKRGGEPLAKAANKRRKTKTNHLYDTAALGGGLPCPAGGGLVLLGTQPAGRRHGVRTTACQPAGAGGRRDEHQLVLFHRAAGAQHPAGHGTVVPAVHQLAYCARGGQRGADPFVSRGVVLVRAQCKAQVQRPAGGRAAGAALWRAVPPVCAGRPSLYSAHCHQLCGAGVRGAHSARRAAAGPGGGHGAVQLCCSAGRAAAAVHLEHSAYRGGSAALLAGCSACGYPAPKAGQCLAHPRRGAAGAHPCGGCCRAGGVPGQRKGAGGKISLPGSGICGIYWAEPGPPAMVCKCAAGFLWLAGGQSVFSGRAV